MHTTPQSRRRSGHLTLVILLHLRRTFGKQPVSLADAIVEIRRGFPDIALEDADLAWLAARLPCVAGSSSAELGSRCRGIVYH